MRIVRKSLFFCMMLMLVSQSLLMPSWGLKSSSAAGPVTVVASQAGYSKEDFKVGSVISDHLLQDETYQVTQNGSQVVYTGTLTYEGLTWGKHVYTFDFSPLELTGDHFKVESNGEASYEFSIEDNIWLQYRDEMTAYYRVQRASVDTADVLPSGYTDTPLSPEAYHDAGHLDDGWDRDGVFSIWDITLDDGTQPAQGLHYDLTGGHYDAGDYGKYAGNQWVGGQLALAYVRHSQSPAVQFDYDNNGVPDIIEEARVNAEYTLKFVDQFDGALFDIPRKGGFQHPILETDGLPLSPAGNPDDREIGQLSVGGTAKAAGMMAATARAYSIWKANEQINDPDVDDFISRSTAGAIKSYEFAYNNQDKNEGSGYTTNDLTNPLLWAEVELYLLTNDQNYYDRAVDRIAVLTESQIRNTGYWDVRPIALADFYPVADATTQSKIQQLLKSEVDRFISSADDTPYGVLNEFSNFGVNEPHLSMIGDALRYYELFGDPEVLTAVKKGLFWVFGNNPWNISWVSGIGEHYVQYPHSRFDQDAYSASNTGVVLPGAMVAGPTAKDPADRTSEASPWYEDRSLAEDGTAQWRYNEHSISIQAGMFYSIMALSAIDDPSVSTQNSQQLQVLSPQTGDYVTGDVRVIAAADNGVLDIRTPTHAMQEMDGVWVANLNVDSFRPYDSKRITVKGETADRTVSSSAHYTVAPPLPSPETPLLYDDFSKNGVWGFQNLGWQNWYTQNGSKDGTFARETLDGREVGRFTHEPSNSNAQAKFQPWHFQANVDGYRYLYITLKNSGRHADLLFKGQVNGKDMNGGYTTVSNDWTTLKIDLDQISGLDKEKLSLAFWLKGGTASGDILIDEISFGNDVEGVAPILSDLSVSQSAGEERSVFHYSITYTDADDDLPHTVQLILDGVIHQMMETDHTDQDVTDGKQYMLSKSMVRGPHVYYVRTTDTSSAVVQTAVQTGPTVSSAAGPIERPTAPRNLHAVAKTESTVVLEWMRSEDDRKVSAYGIYHDGVLLGTVPKDQTHYEVTGLEPGTAFAFYVLAHSETLQHSEASNLVTIQTNHQFTTPARFLGRYAAGANERKAATDWPASPEGFGKIWRGGKLSWTVTVPETGVYPFTLRAYPEGNDVSMVVRVDGQDLPNAAWSLNSGWRDYEGSLGTLTAGTHTIEVRNNSPISGNVDIAHMDIMGALPSGFTLSSPASGAAVETTAVTLDWTQTVQFRDVTLHYAPFAADEFMVVVADNAELTNPIVDTSTTATTLQLVELEHDTTYYWSVTAHNANGSTASDAVFSFTTPASPDPELAARYLGRYVVGANERKGVTDWPGNGTATPDGWGKVWQRGTAKWSVHFPETGVYDFTVHAFGEGTAASFQVKVDGQEIPGAAYALSRKWVDYTGNLGMITEGTHTVEIFNSSAVTNNNVDIAHIDIFGAAPGSFVLMSPVDGATVETNAVTLNWTQVIGGKAYAPFGAADYTVVVADNAELANPQVDATVTTTDYSLSELAYGTTYYWKVTANNANGSTPSDAVFTFTTSTPPDDVAPITVATVQGDVYGEWYRSDVRLTLLATDEGTGVHHTEYRTQGDEAWSSYDGPITIDAEGAHVIEYHSIDHAGNVEESQWLTLSLDKSVPDWSVLVNGAVMEDGAIFLDHESLTFELVKSDTISGISEATLSLDGNPLAAGQPIALAGQLGPHTLEIIVVDHAGHRVEAVISFQIVTSLEALKQLLHDYIQTGDVAGPLVPQLSNSFEQVEHHLSKGDQDKAAKHMEKFLRHLVNPAMSDNVSAVAQAVLMTDAHALIQEWTQAQ